MSCSVRPCQVVRCCAAMGRDVRLPASPSRVGERPDDRVRIWNGKVVSCSHHASIPAWSGIALPSARWSRHRKRIGLGPRSSSARARTGMSDITPLVHLVYRAAARDQNQTPRRLPASPAIRHVPSCSPLSITPLAPKGAASGGRTHYRPERLRLFAMVGVVSQIPANRRGPFARTERRSADRVTPCPAPELHALSLVL
jgi:hypothetical protein